MKIVLATQNRHKVIELQEALGGFNQEILTLEDFPGIGEIDETGTTLLENSLLKARTVHELTGYAAIADDTGLEVDFLGGAPGVYSARYAGPGANFSDNVAKLLAEMKDAPPAERNARFRTMISYVNGGQELWAEGVVEGVILDKPAGTGGFGYDPVFFVPEKDKTFAQLSIEEKNLISHRGLAIKNFRKLFADKIQPYI